MQQNSPGDSSANLYGGGKGGAGSQRPQVSSGLGMAGASSLLKQHGGQRNAEQPLSTGVTTQ